MKSELIFFESVKESTKGFYRSLIAFLVLMAFDFSCYKKINLKFVVTWLLLCSAIGVMLPKNLKESSTLGFLIGTTVYGILTVWLNNGLIFFLKGVLQTTIASVLTFLIYNKI